MTRANQTVTIQLDTTPEGTLRLRTIPPLAEILQLAEADINSLTTAELYGLAALRGIRELQQTLTSAK